MLLGLDTSIEPLTGFRVVLSVFAATVVGVGEEMAGVLLEPAYRTITAFLAILLVLSVRPQGLLGRAAWMEALSSRCWSSPASTR